MYGDWLKTVGRSVGGTARGWGRSAYNGARGTGRVGSAVGRGTFESTANRLGRIGMEGKMSNQQILNRGYRRMGYGAGGAGVGAVGGGYMYSRHRRNSRYRVR